jgi:hypothetical protein
MHLQYKWISPLNLASGTLKSAVEAAAAAAAAGQAFCSYGPYIGQQLSRCIQSLARADHKWSLTKGGIHTFKLIASLRVPTTLSGRCHH